MGCGAYDNTDASQPRSSAVASAIDAHHDEQARPFTPTKKNAEDLMINDQGFIRKNDEISRCVTGQYTMHLSRKVISDYFGCIVSCSADTSNLMRNKQAP
ncbi:hypothetical protein HBI53_008250 [Parastagonospora nodorum]|nr:hypothetical protein HBI54_018950 [Parastagonospora nodorum]KAH6237429.1 hypothetical protein HBI53_008250 [Parastagonospora nodorum]KAH6553833.1 hypothetical protein HBI07_016930 [Parastagonospora nodorum]